MFSLFERYFRGFPSQIPPSQEYKNGSYFLLRPNGQAGTMFCYSLLFYLDESNKKADTCKGKSIIFEVNQKEQKLNPILITKESDINPQCLLEIKCPGLEYCLDRSNLDPILEEFDKSGIEQKIFSKQQVVNIYSIR